MFGGLKTFSVVGFIIKVDCLLFKKREALGLEN
jgi:hypothetical protein